MHSHFQNAIAIVQGYGRPHLFITMTCNIDCAERAAELEK